MLTTDPHFQLAFWPQLTRKPAMRTHSRSSAGKTFPLGSLYKLPRVYYQLHFESTGENISAFQFNLSWNFTQKFYLTNMLQVKLALLLQFQ